MLAIWGISMGCKGKDGFKRLSSLQFNKIQHWIYSRRTRERKINDEIGEITAMFPDLENKEQGAGLDVREGRRTHWGLFKLKAP